MSAENPSRITRRGLIKTLVLGATLGTAAGCTRNLITDRDQQRKTLAELQSTPNQTVEIKTREAQLNKEIGNKDLILKAESIVVPAILILVGFESFIFRRLCKSGDSSQRDLILDSK